MQPNLEILPKPNSNLIRNLDLIKRKKIEKNVQSLQRSGRYIERRS